jgi:hypothetical protein
MLPYLKMLANFSRPLFLMFYQPGYRPEGFEAMHSFEYFMEQLAEMFHGRKIQTIGEYVIVC